MCVFEQNGYDKERDYCIPEDESGTPQGVYVSLVKNPERFTGYSGEHAHAVWREIYRENCFEMQSQDPHEEHGVAEKGLGGSAMSDLEAVMSGRTKGLRVSGATLAQEYNQLRLDNTCLEKRVFWRLISGMHTSISTHLCWDYLNQTTGKWVSPLTYVVSNERDQTLNVSSQGCGIVLSGSKTCTSITSSFSVQSPNCPNTSIRTLTAPATRHKTSSLRKKSTLSSPQPKSPPRPLTNPACSILMTPPSSV
jgi:hypothetical protein